MNVREFIDNYVVYSDLSTLGVVQKYLSSEPATSDKAFKQLISYVNLGVMALHRKFILNTKSISKDIHPGVPFVEVRDKDLGILLAVVDEVGNPLHGPTTVDDDSHDYAEISKGTFLINNSNLSKVIFIYTATPATLKSESHEIDVPDLMIEALLHYVCYKGMATFQSSANQTPIAQNDFYFKRFERECRMLEDQGFNVISNNISQNVLSKGFA